MIDGPISAESATAMIGRWNGQVAWNTIAHMQKGDGWGDPVNLKSSFLTTPHDAGLIDGTTLGCTATHQDYRYFAFTLTDMKCALTGGWFTCCDVKGCSCSLELLAWLTRSVP